MGATLPDKTSRLSSASLTADLLLSTQVIRERGLRGAAQAPLPLQNRTLTSGIPNKTGPLSTPPLSSHRETLQESCGPAPARRALPTHERQRGREASSWEEHGSIPLPQFAGGFPVGRHEQGGRLPEGQAGSLGRERCRLLLGTLGVVVRILASASISSTR